MSKVTLQDVTKQHALAQAYKRITQEMGPSAQLIAFVCRDEIENGSLAMESLDVEAQHQKILADIALIDEAFEMSIDKALQAFTDTN